MESNFKYHIFEYPYGTTRYNQILEDKLNEMGNMGYKVISSQLKPFKNVTSNAYEMIVIFEK